MIKNVLEYLEGAVKKYPSKIAFSDKDTKITYRELYDKARRTAAAIKRECGGKHNCPVAVYIPKSVECIIAFFGILYSGNYYSPLDIHSPVNRVERILNTLEPIALIYNKSTPYLCDCDCPKINLSNVTEVPDQVEKEYQKLLDIDPVYVMFTSGSTGQPKGVVINHRSIIDYVEWLKSTFKFDNTTVFGNQAPFYFDNSILDIYSTIKNGATMVIIPERLFAFPQLLVNYMEQENINTIFWVPSALIGMANSGVLSKKNLTKLKKVLFCGEVMPNKQLNIWRKSHPDILYANLYGPTEITDVCSYYIVDRYFSDDEPLPIGKACENTEILVLNEDNQLVKENETGELCVRGICLSLGYYADPEKSSSSFVQNPLNKNYRDYLYRTGDLVKYNEYGEIIYIGRKDFQIKRQGYRIELGEIETAAYGMPQMKLCCAVYNNETKEIMLYCVLSEDISEKTIYSFMKNTLPKYMLPGKINICAELPLNANGKIDRMKLISLEKMKNE